MEQHQISAVAGLDQPDAVDWLEKDRGLLIAKFTPSIISPSGSIVTSKGGHSFLASYTWLATDSPTIYVPGGAPILKENIQPPFTLPKDTGLEIIDADAYHSPSSPLESVFRAADPSLSFKDIDLLVNRNTMRKFFSICRGQSQTKFRVNLFHKGPKTLIIERCEEYSVLETQEACATYGHNFEDACTNEAPGLKDGQCHHRVVKYDFGGLICAVRFEVDACKSGPKEGVDSDASLDTTSETSTMKSDSAGIKVIRRGFVDPEIPFVELKSSKRNPKPINSILPQLWFGRTTHLVQGIHEDGVFGTIHQKALVESHWFEV
ncbi:hypothetical protein LIA77_06382 [Sarocladium implicatum]|nr:hypothetical protein LIA77_06382 [Sarocladium implicatum]